VRLGLIPQPPEDLLFHGFISYSHAVDGKLAPALQRGLQRFAKPWYRTRALRIFRDEAALSANPHLWTSIAAALEASQYFILLASPEAASSEWVNKEATYWCQHKSVERILIGLTGGDMHFNGAPGRVFSVDRDALPTPLRQVLDEEPRWVGLRWARSADDLAISHPRFRDAIAEMAAPLHGVAKDELSSEEVRQHRRTVRIARTAATVITLLLVVAIVASVVALQQRDNAVQQATIATSRQVAAVSESQLSTNLEVGLKLAVQAYLTNPSVQTRAGLFEADLASPFLVRFVQMGGQISQLSGGDRGRVVVAGLSDGRVLWRQLAKDRAQVVLRFRSAVSSLAVSGDGGAVVASDGTTALLWREGHTPVALRGPPGQKPHVVGISPSGRTVVVGYGVSQYLGMQSVVLFGADGRETAENPSPSSSLLPTEIVVPSDDQLVLFDASSGNWARMRISDWSVEEVSRAFEGMDIVGAFASDGGSFAYYGGFGSHVPVWTTSGPSDPSNPPLLATAPISSATAMALSPHGASLAVADAGVIDVIPVEPPTSTAGSVIPLVGNGSINSDALQFLGNGRALISASGSTVAIWNLDQVDRLGRLFATPLGPTCDGCSGPAMAVSPSGRSVAASSASGPAVIEGLSGTGHSELLPLGPDAAYGPPLWDPTLREFLLPLSASPGGGGTLPAPPRVSGAHVLVTGGGSTVAADSLTTDGRHLIVVNSRGTIYIQDVATGSLRETSRGPGDLSTDGFGFLTRAEASIDPGDDLVAVLNGLHGSPVESFDSVLIRSAETGRVVGEVHAAGVQAVSYAGRQLVVERSDGSLAVWNAEGTQLERVLAGDASDLGAPVASADGHLIARYRTDDSVVVTDVRTGMTLGTLAPPVNAALGLRIGVAFSPTSAALVEVVQTTGGAPALIVDRDISDRGLIDAACATAGAPLTAATWQTFIGTTTPHHLACG